MDSSEYHDIYVIWNSFGKVFLHASESHHTLMAYIEINRQTGCTGVPIAIDCDEYYVYYV